VQLFKVLLLVLQSSFKSLNLCGRQFNSLVDLFQQSLFQSLHFIPEDGPSEKLFVLFIDFLNYFGLKDESSFVFLNSASDQIKLF
jgi:hypothetical protein